MRTISAGRVVFQLLAVAAAASCGGVGEADDGSSSSTTADELSAKFGGIRKGSDTACAVLRIANEASRLDRDEAALFDLRAAENIARFRAGEDGIARTSDDRWFTTLEQLDDVPYVDPAVSFRITVNAFLADGGDGFSILKSGAERTAGGLDLDALLELCKTKSPVAPPTTLRITKL